MPQASLSPDIGSVPPTSGHDGQPDATDGRRTVITFWLFGLTAMTLVFASLLLLGLLMRSGGVDGTIRSAVSAYAALIAGIGIMAVAYVLAMARRAGMFAGDPDEVPMEPPSMADGWAHAPTVPPALALRARQEALAAARMSRSRQAHAITAASTTHLHRQPTGAWPMPGRPAPMQAGVAGVPFQPYVAVSTAHARPTPAPESRPAPGLTPPTRAAAAPSPGGRPPGSAPAFLRMKQSPWTARQDAVMLQLHAANRRGPSGRRPSEASAADRRPDRPVRVPWTPVPSQTTPMVRRVGHTAAPAPPTPLDSNHVGAAQNGARLATPSGRGAAW